jgi:hypothetical protein
METNHAKSGIRPVYQLMHLTFVVVPIVAGLDKFTDLLTQWEQYLHPTIVSLIPFPAHTFMMIVGVIEIIAGLLVLAKPHLGGLIVAAWLAGIALNLLLAGHYLDVAVRDLVMCISAYSMARISIMYSTKESKATKESYELSV